MPTPKAQSASSRMKNGSRRIDHPMVSPYHIARPTTMIDATAKSTKDSATEAAGNISLRTDIFFRDRKSVVLGKRCVARLELGVRRINKKKIHLRHTPTL